MIAHAPPPPVEVSAALTTTEVKVTSGFRGARIDLYGAVFSAKPTDVVVVVRGPEQPITLSRKVRVGGMWINSRPRTFGGTPGYYMAASTRPLSQIATPVVQHRYGLGLASQMPQPAIAPDWRAAAIRLKAGQGLFAEAGNGVTFVDRNLFRAEINLPTTAPIGTYQAEIFLFARGQPVSRKTTVMRVEKAGVERALYLFAHQRPWLYGLVSVLIALAAGWAASAAFRRH